MGKQVNSAVLDAALQYIIDNAAVIAVTKGNDSTSFSATDTLAATAIGSGNFGIATHESGRRLTITAPTDILVTASGSATEIQLATSSASTATVLLTTTCTEQQLTTGNTVTVPAFTDYIAGPV